MSDPADIAAAAFDDPNFPRIHENGICGAVHPEHEGIVCEVPVEKCFERHQAVRVDLRTGVEDLSWPNPRQMPKRDPDKKAAHDMADRVDDGQPPIVRTDDPQNSHDAADLIEPERESRRGEVLAALREANGDWVDAPLLATAQCGGFGGTRRVRELRTMGWPIETRQKPGSTNTWQHRLAKETTAPAPVVLRNFED